MKSTTESRLTFLSFGELFLHLAQRCSQAEASLHNFPDAVGEREVLIIELVAGAEHQLAAELAIFANDAPEKVLATRIQYVLDEPALSYPHTLGQAIENITAVNCQLAATLRDLIEKTAPDTLCDLINALCNRVESANRRISTIRITAFDI